MTEPKIDPNFEGSIFQKLGLSEVLCEDCGAHLSARGICLNACGLKRFQNLRQALFGEEKKS
jgi:hypothetical protein